MKIAMRVEYNGVGYSGWQSNPGVTTVQERVEMAISKVANHPVKVICAGRTDTGVHGVGQIIHFETESQRTITSWIMGCNTYLPKDISISWANSVSEDFHARFSAEKRRYRYVIFNRKVRPALLQDRVTWEYRPLDEKRMFEASRHLLGTHDFTSFRDSQCQAHSPVRTVLRLDITRRQEMVLIDIEANAFLHHMVRNVSGVLLAIGRGEKEPDWAKEVLEARDRTVAGVTAASGGLYFMEVSYPEQYGIPALPPSEMVW